MPHPKERPSSCHACSQRACTLRPPPPPPPPAPPDQGQVGAPMPCTVRAVSPIERAAGSGGGREKKRYNRAVPRTVLAQCLPLTEGVCSMLEAGTQGTKGAEEGHTANPPPPQRGTEGNRSGRGGQEEKTPPHRIQVPRLVLASCSQRAYSGERTTRPPPPTPPHPQEGEEEGEGQECLPPTDKAAGWGGRRDRVRYNRAVPHRVLAPCLPPTEGPPGAGT